MKNLAKIFALVLTVALCFTVLYACKTNQEHVCQDVCDICGKCTSDCEDPVCAEKCPGHTQTKTHTVTIVGAVKTSTIQVNDGEKVTKPSDPTKSGYEFLGWYVGENEYDWNSPVTKDITITAKFNKLFDVRGGSAVKSGDSYTTQSEKTLITFDKEFTKGSLSGSVTPGTANDCGIIFGASSLDLESWTWENSEYYTAIINVNGTVIISHVNNGWGEIANSTVFESSYNPSTEYKFKVQYNDGLLVIFVNDVEVYRNSKLGELPGAIVGYRAEAAGTTFKEVTIDENDLPEDKSAPKVGNFIVRNGSLSEDGGIYTAEEENTLAVHDEYEMINGTISVSMHAGSIGDNGIVFAMTQADQESFWETGTSYYFFFINVTGCAYLGKVSGGTWKECGIVEISGYDVNNTYKLKVEVNDGTIRCYVGDNQYINYTDSEFLIGRNVGIRAGKADTIYSGFTVSAETIEHVAPEGYDIVSGDFEQIAGQIISTSANAMMISKTQTLAGNGTFSAKVMSGSDSGIVFGVNSGNRTSFWEGDSGISYYYFFISEQGSPILAKVAPVYSQVKASTLSAMYSKGTLYELRVVLKDGYAYCYVGDRLMIKSAVTLDGNGVGLRTKKAGVQFKDAQVTDSTELVTADTLIFGHSYTQFWTTYKTDFFDVENILNIGIGGTVADHWLNLTEEVATYNPQNLIYMIGINDMYGTQKGEDIAAKVVQTLNKLHELLPSAKLVLINCNKVPLESKIPFYDQIDILNNKYAEYAAENSSWCKLVDFASAVLDSSGKVDSEVFVADNLHLNALGYQKLTKLVRVALGLRENGVPYDFVNGTGTYSVDGKVANTSQDMLAINNENTFEGGTITAKIKMSTLSDSGIVFGLSDNGLTNYWQSGIDYYEFFLTAWNGVYLAKINGTNADSTKCWNELRSYACGIQANTEYTLKVEWVNGNIRCYVDDVLYINYTDDNPLTGNKYGYRAIGLGVEYSAITVSDTATELLNVTDYKLVSGGAKEQDGKVVSISQNVLAVNNSKTFSDGILTTTIKTVAGSDSGIVFGLSDSNLTNYWEQVTYYFLFINLNGDVLLTKTNPWTDLGNGGHIENFDASKTYSLKIKWENGNIKCYVDDKLYIDYTDSTPLTGTKFGYRTNVIGVEYGAIELHTCVFDQQVATADYLSEAATCTKKATYFYSCTCGKKGTATFESGELAAHTVVVDAAVEPTCTTEGKTEGSHCSVCGQVIVAQTAISAKGHSYAETWSYDSTNHWHAATCEHSDLKKDEAAHTLVTGEDGYTQTCSCCSYSPAHVCTFDKKVTTPKYLNKAATCTEAATYFYSCICGAIGTKTFEDGAPLDHTYDQKVVETKYRASAATCTEAAKYYYSCKCGATGTETFEDGEKKGHSFLTYVSDGNATNVSDGTKTAKCERCDVTDTVADAGSALVYNAACGSAKEVDGIVYNLENQTLLVNKTATFSQGTISAKIKMDPLSDSGIVFGLSDNGKTEYWESDVSYYEFFLTSWNGVYLVKIDNGWKEITSFACGIQANTEYTLKVEWKDGNIKCYVNDELYIDYTDASPLTGNKYGYRTYGANVQYSAITVSETVSDAIEFSKYSVASKAAKGSGNAITTLTTSTLLVNKTETFAEGTMTATIKTVAGSDSGIIFGLTDGGNATFFQDVEGVSYYFFFINENGDAYLAKVAPGWNQLGNVTHITEFDASKTYTLKVEWKDGNIRCYVDDTMYVDYTDESPLTGTKYGYRANVAGVVYGQITTTDTVSERETAPVDYSVVNGGAKESSGKITTTIACSLLVNKTATFENGTIIATLKTVSGTDNGIAFNITDGDLTSYWEGSGISYYFFFVSLGGYAYLGKTDSGAWTACQTAAISNFDANGTYVLKVEKVGDNIKCYVNDSLYIDYVDANVLAGTKFGLRAAGAGAVYSNISCVNTGAITETTPNDVTVVSGTVTGSNGSAKTAAAALALMSDKLGATGTLSAQIAAENAGLVFGYKNADSTESYYRFNINKTTWKIELSKVVNGTATLLQSNYFTAGYSSGTKYTYKVVVKDGKAYCHFFNTLYFVQTLDSDIGDGVGFACVSGSANFYDYALSTEATVETVDTLLFGHSYFELWSNYKTDLATIDGLGTYTNIGIGGSIASHWNNFEDSIVAYQPKLAIYMIGINDLTGGTSPAIVTNNVKTLLLGLKEKLPELKVILLGVNYCTARETIKDKIAETNKLYKSLADQYSWIVYADLETAFCDADGNALASWFTDGLHPTADGYVQKIVPAIQTALTELNNSSETDEEEAQAKLLANSKETKKIALSNYSQEFYCDAEWTSSAKAIYEQAIAVIDACATVDAVSSLDLSTYISQLSAIKNRADYLQESIVAKSGYETTLFTNAITASTNNNLGVADFGWRVTSESYKELNFTFKLASNSADVTTAGILFNASICGLNGVDGYLINFVTANNYLQVYHLENGFAQYNGTQVCDYIGGWAYEGTVANTLFRAIVKDGYIRLYEDSMYQMLGEGGYGLEVKLTHKSGISYTHGGVGLLCWQSGLTAQFEIANFGATATDNATLLAEAKAAKKQSVSAYGESYFPADVWTSSAKALYEQMIAKIDACTTVSEVNALDLSSITTQMDALTSNADAVRTDILSESGYETTTFTNTLNASTSGFDLADCGHRISTDTKAKNFDIVLKVTNTSGEISSGSILVRANYNDYDGYSGYRINFNTQGTNQFVQIYYEENAFARAGDTSTTKLEWFYLTGWVFPGNVVGTEFRIRFQDNMVYIWTEESYLKGADPSITYDLRGPDGTYNVWGSGSFGVFNWESATKNIEITKLSITDEE